MSEFVQDRAGRVGEERLVAALRYTSKRLGGWWTYDPANEEPDLRLLLHEAADEVLRLRELIGQAAAEATHGELTDGTLASMTEVAEHGE